MPSFAQIPRGIKDFKVALLTNDAPGANTDVLGIKGYSVEVSSDSDSQTGDDTTLAVVQENKTLDVTVTAAATNPDAMGIMSGFTPTTSGTTPNQIIVYKEPAIANTRYVQLIGQAAGRDATGSATRLTVLKAQLTGGPNLDFSDGEWMEPEFSLTGVGRGSPSYLFDLSHYETEVALT